MMRDNDSMRSIDPSQRSTPGALHLSGDSLRSESHSGVRLTCLDWSLLGFIDEQFAVTIEQLRFARAVLGGGHVVSERAVRLRLDRWQRLNLVTKHRRLGRDYISLASGGRRLLGSDYPLWSAPEARLAHTAAVTWCRLWYEWDHERLAKSGRWVSERQLFRERGSASYHLHDAELELPGREGRVGVEVELTFKTPSRRYGEILNNVGPHVRGVMYVCEPTIVDRVCRATAKFGPPSIPVWVRPLTDVRTQRPATVGS